MPAREQIEVEVLRGSDRDPLLTLLVPDARHHVGQDRRGFANLHGPRTAAGRPAGEPGLYAVWRLPSRSKIVDAK